VEGGERRRGDGGRLGLKLPTTARVGSRSGVGFLD
jgi:hypothetical protein